MGTIYTLGAAVVCRLDIYLERETDGKEGFRFWNLPLLRSQKKAVKILIADL